LLVDNFHEVETEAVEAMTTIEHNDGLCACMDMAEWRETGKCEEQRE